VNGHPEAAPDIRKLELLRVHYSILKSLSMLSPESLKRYSTTKSLLAVVLITQLCLTAFSQQPSPSPTPAPEPTPTGQQKTEDVDVVRITTNLVQVDAVVTDKNGKIVTDLKPDEIEIYEDGHKQKITNFSYFQAEPANTEPAAKSPAPDKTAVAPPVPVTRLRPEDVRRTIALVVDDLGLSWESIYYVRRALKKFVDEQMQPGDLVAIIRTSGGIGALQSFTSDKRQLYAAIERVKWNAIGRSGISAFAPIERPSGNQAIDEANAEANETREDMFAVGTLGAISYVVKGLKELPGRKSILLVSDGFRIYKFDDPRRDFMALERLRRLVDEAGRASVVIYTMNATGLQTLGLTAADDLTGRDASQIEEQMTNRRHAAYETQEGLDYLAHETGGMAIRNTNDLSSGIKRVLADQKGYYLIGYRPDSGTFDPRTGRRTFHKLSLKVTRPGKFTVRMRNGFYGVTDEDRQTVKKTLAQQLIGALVSPFGSTGVHLRLTSVFGNDQKYGSFMRSALYIDGRDLTFVETPEHRHKGVFDVLAMTFGDNGAAVDSSGKTFTVELTDEWYKRTQRDGLVYYVTVPIKKPGAYQLRVSLRDSGTERVGSASQFVEVPDIKKNRIALSGVTLSGSIERPPGTNGANGGAADAQKLPADDNDQLDQGDAEASPAVRRFRHGMLMDYVFFIYNARLDKATNQPNLTWQVKLFQGSKPVFEGKANGVDLTGQTDLKRLLTRGRIRLGNDLAPGEYVLQVIVTDALADEKHRTVSQWMDFEIIK